jgi:hypothetical protein
MAKRLSLNKLISYITTNCIHQPEPTNNDDLLYDINDSNNAKLENINFTNLVSGETRNISDLPKNLKTIFDPFIKDIKRHGVSSKYSLLYSVLYCIDDQFRQLAQNLKEPYLVTVKEKLLQDLVTKKYFQEYMYSDLEWKLDDLTDSIDKQKNNKMLLRYIADYFNINIFLLNISEDKIYAIYNGTACNIYKSSVFLTYYKDIFEPLEYEKTKSLSWSYDTDPFKKLTNVDKAKIVVMSFKLDHDSENLVEFQTSGNDLTKYLPEKHNAFTEINDKNGHMVASTIHDTETEVHHPGEISDDQDIFFKKEEAKKATDPDLDAINDKMKLIDLQVLAAKYKIDLKDSKGKKKLKSQLIEELNDLKN